MLTKIRYQWVLAGVGCLGGYLLLESVLLHLFTKKLYPKQKFLRSVRVSMIGQYFNCITPFSSGGQPMQAYAMYRQGVPMGTATTALLCKFIVYQFVLTIYTLFIMIFKIRFFVAKVDAFALLAVIGFSVNLAVVIGLVCIAFFPKPVERFVLFLIRIGTKMKLVKKPDELREKTATSVQTFYNDFQYMKKQIPLILLSALLTAVQLSFFLLIPYMVYRAFCPPHVDVISIMSAAAFVMLLSAFIPIPGTIGAAEGSFYMFFKLFFPGGTIKYGILLWRMFTFYALIVIGGTVLALSPKSEKPQTLDELPENLTHAAVAVADHYSGDGTGETDPTDSGVSAGASGTPDAAGEQ